MGEMAEDWRIVREYKRAQSAKRRTKNITFLQQVIGYVITEKTPYQFRVFGEEIGDFMDIYPTNQRYHNLITGERGHYKTIQGFLDMQYEITKDKLAKQQ